MKSTLINRTQEERKIGWAVTSFQIKSQAEQTLIKDGKNDLVDFKVSNGWLERFLNKHNIGSRSVTIICQKIKDDTQKLRETFVSFFADTANDVNISCIRNMDEILLWFA